MAIYIEDRGNSDRKFKRIWQNQRHSKQGKHDVNFSEFIDVDLTDGAITMSNCDDYRRDANSAKLRITMLQKAVEISEGVTQ